MYLEKYIKFFRELVCQKSVWVKYSMYQDNLASFIKNLPTIKNLDKSYEVILNTNLDDFIMYVNKFPFQDAKIQKLKSYLNREKILEFLKEIVNHKNAIIDILQIDETLTFYQKKRIYLGIIWFAIGFYICFVIGKVNNFSNLITLSEASGNKYMVFLTCCFIYYDDIIDSQKISLNLKKICIEYTFYFFEQVSNNYESIQDISQKYLEKVNFDINPDINRIIEKTNRILNIFFNLYRKEQNPKILYSILNLFRTEVTTSKIQHNRTNKDNVELLLKCTIQKSEQSVLAILQCLYPELDCQKDNILDLIYKFSFLSQLLDDLNDIEIDIEENNNTIFTSHKKIVNVKKTLQYIYTIQDFMKNTNIPEDYKQCNHYLNILIFNYAVGKNKTIREEFDLYLPINNLEIMYLKENKTNYLKKLNKF